MVKAAAPKITEGHGSEKALLNQFQLYVDVCTQHDHFRPVYKDMTFDDKCHSLVNDLENYDL